METVFDILRNSVIVMIAVSIVAGALVFTGNALVTNSVEDEPQEH